MVGTINPSLNAARFMRHIMRMKMKVESIPHGSIVSKVNGKAEYFLQKNLQLFFADEKFRPAPRKPKAPPSEEIPGCWLVGISKKNTVSFMHIPPTTIMYWHVPPELQAAFAAQNSSSPFDDDVDSVIADNTQMKFNDDKIVPEGPINLLYGPLYKEGEEYNPHKILMGDNEHLRKKQEQKRQYAELVETRKAEYGQDQSELRAKKVMESYAEDMKAINVLSGKLADQS